MIEIRDVAKRFGAQIVLDGVSLTVNEGETMALLGPSGTGKSVLLKHIIGLIRPDRGEVIVDGLHVEGLNRKDLSKLRATIGYVFQNGALFDSMDVFENIRLGLTDPDQYSDKAYVAMRVAECLHVVNLPAETGKKMPSELSGGMRKRVGISRAIAGKPKYVLYDEPTSGLDPETSNTIDDLISRLGRDLGTTSVVVTHDMHSVLSVADRIAFVSGGTVPWIGTIDDLHHATDETLLAFVRANEYKIGVGS